MTLSPSVGSGCTGPHWCLRFPMALRALVSKKKIRYQEDGFDLDLTLITPRIIAMGAPSEGSEASYRNPMSEVQRFFDTKYKGKHKLFDLRAEKGVHYDPSRFHGSVARYGFFDHNPAPLKLIRDCCEDMDSWLKADPENVVAVHCKAGKGRTGLIIAAYLVFSGVCGSTTEALRLFGDMRTLNGKGVTIPSQMRYVHYFEVSLKREISLPTYRLRHIRLHTVPNFDVGGGCDPYFDVRLGDGKQLHFDWRKENKGKVKNYRPKHKIIDLPVWDYNVRIQGDVKFVFYDHDNFSAPDKMFHFWIHTGFIDNNYLLFHKDVLDRACKDKACKEFDPEFKVELFLDQVPDIEGEFSSLKSEYLEADNDDDMDDD